MKLLCLTLAISCVSSTLFQDELWDQFKVKFNRNYKTIAENDFRKQIFMKELSEIEKHNENYEQGLSSYKQGINQFSDWTWEEFSQTILMKPNPDHNEPKLSKNAKVQKAPKPNADWRMVMNPVKDQGHCGSCWAFATIGAIEAARVIGRYPRYPKYST